MFMSESALDPLPHWKLSAAKGSTIYVESEPSTTLYRIERGCVRLLIHGEDGSRQIAAFLFPPQLFGYCVEQRNTSAEAVTDAELTAFPIRAVFEIGGGNEGAAIELLDSANSLVHRLAHHLDKVAHLAAEDRVMWFFAWLADQPGVGDGRAPPTISLPMSFADVADHLNLKPETLSRVLRQLEEQHRIHRIEQRVFVVDAVAAMQADLA